MGYPFFFNRVPVSFSYFFLVLFFFYVCECVCVCFYLTTDRVGVLRWVVDLRDFFLFFLPSFTSFYLFSENDQQLKWVSLGFTGFYWVLPTFTGFYWVILGFTGFYRVLPSFTEFYRV